MEIGKRVSCKAAYLCRWIIYDAEQLSKVGTLRERSSKEERQERWNTCAEMRVTGITQNCSIWSRTRGIRRGGIYGAKGEGDNEGQAEGVDPTEAIRYSVESKNERCEERKT